MAGVWSIPVSITGTDPAGPSTIFLGTTSHGKLKNPKGGSQLEREIALVKSRLPMDHPLNTMRASSSNAVEGTIEEDSGSTEIDEEEREFSYYMARQARNNSRANKNKGGFKMRGRSSRNPSGI